MVFRKRSGFVYEVVLLARIYLALIKNLVLPLNHEDHLNEIGWRFLHLSTSRTVRYNISDFLPCQLKLGVVNALVF